MKIIDVEELSLEIEEKGDILEVKAKMGNMVDGKRKNFGAKEIRDIVEKNSEYKILRVEYSSGVVRNYDRKNREASYKFRIKKEKEKKSVVKETKGEVDDARSI